MHELALTDDWNWPTAHNEQSDAPAALYLPAPQPLLHVPSLPPKSPAGQSLHTAAPMPLCWPAGHVMHCSAAAPLYVLLAHCVQFHCPASG